MTVPLFGQSLGLPDPTLAVLTVKAPGSFLVSNLDIVPLTLIFDSGPFTPAVAVVPLGSGALAPPRYAFTGRIQVIGAAGTQFTAAAS